MKMNTNDALFQQRYLVVFKKHQACLIVIQPKRNHCRKWFYFLYDFFFIVIHFFCAVKCRKNKCIKMTISWKNCKENRKERERKCLHPEVVNNHIVRRIIEKLVNILLFAVIFHKNSISKHLFIDQNSENYPQSWILILFS